ncbi:unnamed protein product [Hermetia illucens]|uniref:Uncharacterized protein n=1 Tax=Hermetia illucens TaxID=343691 RepID=A0A7R8UN58_HERIL|nr:unnamed protein product [Hermetia illucens]
MKIYKPVGLNDDTPKAKSFAICQKSLRPMMKNDLRKVVTISQAVSQETNRLKTEIDELAKKPNIDQTPVNSVRQSKFVRTKAFVWHPNSGIVVKGKRLTHDSQQLYSVKGDLERFERFKNELKKIMQNQGTGVLSKPILGSALRGKAKKSRKILSFALGS